MRWNEHTFHFLDSAMLRNSLFVRFHWTFTFFHPYTHTPKHKYSISKPFYSYYADILTHCGNVFAHDTHIHSFSSVSSLCPAAAVFILSMHLHRGRSACLDWLFHVQSCYWISGLHAYHQPYHVIHCTLWVNICVYCCLTVSERDIMLQRAHTRFNVGQCSCIFFLISCEHRSILNALAHQWSHTHLSLLLFDCMCVRCGWEWAF